MRPVFPLILTAMFVGLKLAGYISWSWLWVLAPLWVPAAFILFWTSIVLLVCAIKAFNN